MIFRIHFMGTPAPGIRAAFVKVSALVLLWVLTAVPAFHAAAAQTPAPGSVDTAFQDTELLNSVQAAIDKEQEGLRKTGADITEMKAMLKAWEPVIKAYQIQHSAHAGLLYSPQVATRELEASMNDVRSVLALVGREREDLSKRIASAEKQKETATQQMAVYGEQFDKWRKVDREDPRFGPLAVRIENLVTLLKKHRDLLEELLSGLKDQESRFSDLGGSFSDLEKRLQTRIQERRTTDLFERRQGTFVFPDIISVRQELKNLEIRWRSRISAESLKKTVVSLFRASGISLFLFPLLLFLLVILVLRMRRFLKAQEGRRFLQQNPWHHVAERKASGSLMTAGMTVFFVACAQIDVLYLSAPWLHLVARLLEIRLLTLWGMTMMRAAGPEEPSERFVAARKRIFFLLRFVRWYGSLFLVLAWVFPNAESLHLLLRLVLEAAAFVWCIRFAVVLRYTPEDSPEAGKARIYISNATATSLQIAATIGVVMELLGYGALALHWYVSIGRSLAVMLWWFIFLRMLFEVDTVYRKKSMEAEGQHATYPFVWLLVRLGLGVWALSLAAMIVFAFGGRQAVMVTFIHHLSRPVAVGSMSFSILGCIYAVLVLLVTHSAARLWRYVFQTKFLADSGMETGLQDSITTLTVYLLWGLGILISLHVFGLNAASLAVAFGAVGIGLGFGLQNIFNNFISGIILLFERPIQVGDDVEINGVWATVRRINVRSTIVQTYDNASLIIPNSEFISSQVTNWSFKDKRLRRIINVGVAYGSDTRLVEKTLLEIAAEGKNILKYPRPDVLFSDFGDNALVFRLRLWTDIDNMLKVETAVRFEIDRRFNDLGIVIAYPQRDVYIKSLPDHLFRKPEPMGGEAGPPASAGPEKTEEEDPGPKEE